MSVNEWENIFLNLLLVNKNTSIYIWHTIPSLIRMWRPEILTSIRQNEKKYEIFWFGVPHISSNDPADIWGGEDGKRSAANPNANQNI